MKAMVLAAGKGKEPSPLPSLPGQLPKPMAPALVDVPLIRHIFELLGRHGITGAYVNIHYLAEGTVKGRVNRKRATLFGAPSEKGSL